MKLYGRKADDDYYKRNVPRCGWELLFATAVRDECNDFIKALIKGDERKARLCEKWFVSEWGQMFCQKQGFEVIRQCKKIAEEKMKTS